MKKKKKDAFVLFIFEKMNKLERLCEKIIKKKENECNSLFIFNIR